MLDSPVFPSWQVMFILILIVKAYKRHLLGFIVDKDCKLLKLFIVI